MRNFYLLTKRLPLVLLLLVSIPLWAQNIKITGQVTSGDDGAPLPGVSILEKGTTNGTVSDAEGNYSISVKENGTLVFSFVGFQTQEIAVSGRSVANVVLASDVTALNEIVVVGYGQQEKKDVTGVVAAVDSKVFNQGAIVSPDQLITGKVAGVQITSNSGEPGGQSTVRIRGGTSINAGNDPLYVIDGVPIDNTAFNPGGFSSGRNPLNFINPNDIETFTVLKDASAAAIYGSRAANGVIIITTKKGKSGTPTVTYDGYFSVGTIAKKQEVFNASQFQEVVAAKAPSNLRYLGNANTNWQDEIYQTALGQNHSVTLSGGTDKFNYRASIGRQELDGIIKTSSTKRTSFALSLTQYLLNNDLTITTNVKGSHTLDRFSPDVVGAALTFAPTQAVKDPNSPYGGYFEWYNTNPDGSPIVDANGRRQYDFLAVDNPVSSIKQTQDYGETFRSLGNIQFDYKIPFLEGLRANVNLGYDITRGDRKRFRPSKLIAAATDTGEVKYENLSRISPLLEAYLAYAKTIGNDHKIDVTAGYSYQSFDANYYGYRAYRLATDIYGFNNPSVAKKTDLSNPSVQTNRLISFFGRLNYGFRDKYLLTLSVRRDGSTRFAESNRWGIFPSAAFAWRVIDESFMSGLSSVFSDLKLRVGYGINGNQEIGNYLYLPTYTSGTTTAQYQFGNGYVTTLRPNGFDSKLKWEQTASLNVGLDYAILNGRVSGSLEYYEKNTSDLLFEVTIPAGSNLTNKLLTNIGKIQNRGFEFTSNVVAIAKRDLTLNFGFNFAVNKNKIKALDGSDDPTFVGYETGGISGGTGNNIQILKVGQAVNSFFVYKQKYGPDGKPLVDGVDHNEDGKIDRADMYEDVTGDNIVDDKDRRPFKKPAPTFLFGFTPQLTYKRFDLSMTLRANLGNYAYNNVASNAANYNRASDTKPNNMLTSVLNTNFTTPQYFSDYYIEKASFLRMDNITLGYNLNDIVKKFKLRVYGTVQNAFVLTKYTGLDPEISNGIDNNLYPRSRTFILGVNVGF
jgi:iron complex outermembrane receptor protein